MVKQNCFDICHFSRAFNVNKFNRTKISRNNSRGQSRMQETAKHHLDHHINQPPWSDLTCLYLLLYCNRPPRFELSCVNFLLAGSSVKDDLSMT